MLVVRNGSQWLNASSGLSSVNNSEGKSACVCEWDQAPATHRGDLSRSSLYGLLLPPLSQLPHSCCVEQVLIKLCIRGGRGTPRLGQKVTKEEALAVVQVKMIKDQSKILIARMSNRGRSGEGCRSENGKVLMVNSMCGVEKKGGFLMPLGLLRMVVSLTKLRNKAGVCGGEYGFYFPCEEFKALWETQAETVIRKLDSRVWSSGRKSVPGSFVNHEHTGREGTYIY